MVNICFVISIITNHLTSFYIFLYFTIIHNNFQYQTNFSHSHFILLYMHAQEIKKQISLALNFQYKTTHFSNNQTFLSMIQVCQLALRQQIDKIKYGFNTFDEYRFGIKHQPCEISPFPEEQRKQLLWLGEMCEKVIEQPVYDTVNALNQYVKKEKQKSIELDEYYFIMKLGIHYINLKEAFIYTGLSQCKIWFTICRQRRKSGKQFDLDPLISCFDQIVKRLELKEPFHMNILPRKHVRHLQKKSNQKKINNQLFEAVAASNYDKVKELIHKNHDIELPSFLQDRRTIEVRCTHQACLNKDLKMCKLLHSYGANWEAEDTEKMSPLFYAIQSANLEIIRFLVQEVKVQIQKQQVQHRTPFYWACTQGDIDVIDYLYKKGCNINHKSALGRTALSKSCYLGRVDIVQYLLKCKQIDLYSKDKKGRTALHNAVFGPKGGREGHKFGSNEKDSPECAGILLQNGFKVDQKDEENNTSLHIAMSSQAIDSIRVLLAYNASLTETNNYGETPLMTGAKFGHQDSVKLLFDEYNADIEVIDIYNKNVLLLTAKFKQNGPDGTNPVFYLLLHPFIEKMLKKGNIQELHRTFKELLMKNSYKQLSKYILALGKYEVKFPLFSVDEIDKILQMSITDEGKYVEKQLGNSLGQILIHEAKINQNQLYQVVFKLILRNELKLLEYVLDKNLLKIRQMSLPCQTLFASIEESLLRQKIITFCLLSFNFNWLSFSMKNKSNIFHLLVRKRMSGTIIQLIKALNGKIPQNILTNAHVKADKGELKRLFEMEDDSGLTPFDLSLILKNRSLAKILQQKLKQSNLQENIHGLDIKQYKVILQKNEQQIALFQKGHQNEEQLVQFQAGIQSQSNEELQQFYIQNLKQNADPQKLWKQSDERQFQFIMKEQKLTILEQLAKQNVIGIDIQYFVHESITIMSTLQLSSIHKDYIIDCLLIPLQPIKKYLVHLFHSPKIIKIIHGADNDLILIKSHFNLSLINFIDTSRVDIELREQNRNELRGLSVLCRQFIHISMSKEYQVSEWRVRPIPKVMLQYGRKDSFVLILLLPLMLQKLGKDKKIKDIILSGCKQVRRNKKSSQPLICGINQL